jgi:uncharacterized membrane protein YbhN (UPF0104 family)
VAQSGEPGGDSTGKLRRLLRHLPALLGVGLLIGAIYVVQREVRHLKIADIQAALREIPDRALLVSGAWTVASYLVLTFYDRLGTFYAGKPVTYLRVAFASFCAYALSHNLGFAAVSGAAVRYRLYAHWGLTPLQIGKVVAFCSLTFGLGAMVLGGAILFSEPRVVPFFGDHFPPAVLYLVACVLWAIVGAYVVIARFLGTFVVRGHSVQLPSWRMAILQVLLATVDVALTAAIFYALLPAGIHLNYTRFLGVYLASYSAGLAANLPGGIGVFDTAMLIGLADYLEPPQIIGAILVFRLYYYIIPLFLAGTLFASNEILLRGRGVLKKGAPRPGNAGLLRWSEPDFAVAAAAGAVAMCGVLLLSIGVVEPRPDFAWIDPDFAEVVNSAGQFIPSLIGAALVVLSFAMSQRVTLAWGATIGLLLLAAAFTVAQGENLWVPAVLVLATGLILPFRNAFYRHARLIAAPLRVTNLVQMVALIGCILTLAAFEPHVRWLSNNSFWEVILSPDVPNSLRASVAATVILGLAALYRLVRPTRVPWLPWNAEARLRYAALGGVPPAAADGIVWGENERAAIPFRRVGRVLLGLGDPAGADSDVASTVWRLRDLAQQRNLDPAVWSARPDLFKLYADIGLDALPLDPEGRPCGSLEDVRAGQPRTYLVCVAERDLPVLLPMLPDLAMRGYRQEAAE